MPSYYSLSHNIFLVWDDPAVFVSCGVQEILSSGTTVFCISQLQKTTQISAGKYDQKSCLPQLPVCVWQGHTALQI